jgi:very-short-patch-repair endonuclease
MWTLPKLPAPSKRLLVFAQENRLKVNPAVERLDAILQNGCLKHKFQREFVFGNFCIADFYSPYLGVAIEVNGGSHYRAAVKARDKEKRAYYKKLGVRLIEFSDKDIENYKSCLKQIHALIKS